MNSTPKQIKRAILRIKTGLGDQKLIFGGEEFALMPPRKNYANKEFFLRTPAWEEPDNNPTWYDCCIGENPTPEDAITAVQEYRTQQILDA